MHNHSHTYDHTHTKEFLCEDAAPSLSTSYCSLERKRLIFAIIVTAITMIVEVVGGVVSGSLALVSDAGHMFSHVFALLISYFAIRIACLPPTDSHSFGFYRAEILAALINGVTLLLISAWIIYEAWLRLKNPTSIASTQMLIVAIIGLVVNIITALLLKSAAHHDLNIRSAFIHMIGDLGSSVGVVVAAIVIELTGLNIIDPIVSVFIALVIVYWSIKLLWDAARVLLQSTPKHINVDDIGDAIKAEIKDVKGVHHIHVWELTSHMYVLTAHVEVDDMMLSNAKDLRGKIDHLLKSKFCISHSNLEFEAK